MTSRTITDGRNIDPDLGGGGGEARSIQIEHPELEFPVPEVPARREAAAPKAAAPSYYGLPVLKAPVWEWYIPIYFWVGGAAGAAAALGALAPLSPALHGLTRRCRQIAAAGTMAGAALLIADLGRPARFLNMLRVFRPTSAMNVGAWVLAGAGGSSVGALAGGWIGRAFGATSGAFGLPLSGYTAVLLTGTANPAWQSARATMPPLFVSSGIAAAASLLEMFPLDDRESQVVRRFGTAGRSLELLFSVAMEREVERRAPEASVHYRSGAAGFFLGASKVLTGASLLAGLLPRPTRFRRLVTGLLGTAGSLALRFGVSRAGAAAALDPQATFGPQRKSAEAGGPKI